MSSKKKSEKHGEVQVTEETEAVSTSQPTPDDEAVKALRDIYAWATSGRHAEASLEDIARRAKVFLDNHDKKS